MVKHNKKNEPNKKSIIPSNQKINNAEFNVFIKKKKLIKSLILFKELIYRLNIVNNMIYSAKVVLDNVLIIYIQYLNHLIN